MSNGETLRFAALIRVSTEQQEQQGESLRTQTKQIDRAVESLGGEVVIRYAGQEHATLGYERLLLDKLLADATRASASRAFDAVMVADPSRWSRDNVKSETGLDSLKTAGVRFFVLTQEQNLFDPQVRLFLGMSAVIGQFQARVQRQKSTINRIERLRAGIPSAGKIPFGRTFDRKSKTWAVDVDKLAMIEDCAARYLAGEPLPRLAREYGVNHSQLCLTLRERCGEDWSVRFDDDELNIHETVTVKVPRLLPEKTIALVRHRLKANRTYIRSGGRQVNDYLLSGHIFCAACGYALCGQVDRHGVAHYRHHHHDGAVDCSVRPRPWVRADKIEQEVVGQLFDMFGNPTAIERAVQAAVPDCENELKRRERLEADLAAVGKARDRVLERIVRGLLTDDQADKTLMGLKDREAGLRVELDKVAAVLADVPDPETVRCYVAQVEGAMGTSTYVLDDDGNTYEGGNDVQSYIMMTREDKRRLVDAVFGTPLADGTPAGVYVAQVGEARPYRPKKWSFKIRGRLEFELVMRSARYSATTSHNKLNSAPPFELEGCLSD